MRHLLSSCDIVTVRPLSLDEKTQAAVLLHRMEESVEDTFGDRFETAAKELSTLLGPIRRMRATAA
jgi:hypothetical protein